MAQLKIKFVVTDEDDKYVTFEDKCNTSNIQEYFHRIALALGSIYGHGGPRVLKVNLAASASGRKIPFIKSVRMLSHAGLKQAKEAVEAPDGVFMIVESADEALLAARYIKDNSDYDVDIIPISTETYMNRRGFAVRGVTEQIHEACSGYIGKVDSRFKTGP